MNAGHSTKSRPETHIEGLEQFKDSSKLFTDLTKRCYIETTLDVITIIITYDSQFCIVMVTDNKDREYSRCELQSYALKTHKKKFQLKYEGEYIKMNQVE